MKEAVLIKSFPNGIALHLDPKMEFEDLLKEIGYKFSEARTFFGTATMALSMEGRSVSETEELRILDVIRENSDLHIICLVGKDEETNKNFIKALTHMEKKMSENADGQFFKGSLRNKEVLETENSIIILGDVDKGSAVISAKNIIILGSLYGEAYAGGNGRPGAFVAALEMEPERIKIGDFKYKYQAKAKWSIRSKAQPKIAYVKDERIVFEPLTKELLNTF